MRCIQLDFLNKDTAANGFTYQLRTAFLLGNTVNCIGTSAFYISFKHFYTRLSVKQKVDLVSKSADNDENTKELIDIYYHHLQTMKKWKHPPQNVFMAHKRIENAIEIIVSSWADQIYEAIKTAGLEDMVNICENDVFDIYDINRELSLTSRIYLHPKDVLNNQSPTNAVQNSIWLMPNALHHNKFFENNIIITDGLIKENEPYLIKFFEFSCINTLSITQLVSVKNQLKESLVSFRNDMEIWAKKCYAGSGNQFAQETLLAHIPMLQNELDSNLILQHNQSLHPRNTNSTSIFIGEISPISFWKYHLYFSIITEEEFEELSNNYNAAEPYHIPVLVFCPFESLEYGTYDGVEIQEEAQEVLPVKKSISLD